MPHLMVNPVDHPVLHANKIAQAMSAVGVTGSVDFDRAAAAPQQRGIYFTELVFDDMVNAAAAASMLEGDGKDLAVQATFLSCLNQDNDIEYAPQIMLNDTWLTYAVPMGNKVHARLMIDVPHMATEYVGVLPQCVATPQRRVS